MLEFVEYYDVAFYLKEENETPDVDPLVIRKVSAQVLEVVYFRFVAAYFLCDLFPDCNGECFVFMA